MAPNKAQKKPDDRTGAADDALAPRRAALSALRAVMQERRMLSGPDRRLPPEQAARAHRLAQGVLRYGGRLDAALNPYLDRRPPPPVADILRLGAWEMLVDGAAPHGVVASLVEIAKRGRGTARAAGMVNAVLRRVDAEARERWPDLPPQRMPGWLRKPLLKAWGPDAVAAIEAAHERGAATDLTLKEAGGEMPGAQRLPTGSWRLETQGQISALPGYAEGAFWVQDAAAALPVRMLGDVAGMRVLDLCAAPGGKTMQLAAAGAKVTALDISGKRLERVAENLARTGLSAELVAADALDWQGGPFDAVLLDAPCSATGTIRRHPELPYIRRAEDAEALTRLQMQLIDRALSFLAPGGRLVFCTCSLLPNEGENQVRAALRRHEGLHVLPLDPAEFGGEAAWRSPEGGWRLRPDFWPDCGGLDGFYMACLQIK